jgi:hypothetical protein
MIYFGRVALVLLCIINTSIAQEKYWISFKNKNVENHSCYSSLSRETIENRKRFNLPLWQWTDIAVDQSYIDSLKFRHVAILRTSKWLNAVSAYLTPQLKHEIASLSFVHSIVPIDNHIILTQNKVEVETYSASIALEQMQSAAFLKEGLTGKGVKLGVIDAGFYKANTDKYLEHIFAEFRILGQRDFIDTLRKDIIVDKSTDSDGHGRRVLDMICGYDENERSQTGMAVNASIYLARTENGAREYRGEEDNWIAAMEWMDSLGIRLISTSLGYAINMDDERENYKVEEMNGKTARISRAAQIAAEEKGIFLVVSAGNEGNTPNWRIVSAPADAEAVLSVGATRDVKWDKIGYSSIGPEFLPYLKPNVSCYSPDGTSFSAPVVTGFVACLMQKAPHLSNKELKKIVEKSGHLYPYGNNYVGYGVPQAEKALELLRNPDARFNNISERNVYGNKYKIKLNKLISGDGVVFHKKNETIVVSQNDIVIKKRKWLFFKRTVLLVDRKKGVQRSTIFWDGKVTEIMWK